MNKLGTMVLLLASVVMLSGCTKTYKTIDEYESAMKDVSAKIPAYTIEAKQNVDGTELYYKTYLKGEKWKSEFSMNGGSSYMAAILYDGTDLLSYSQGSPYALKNPMLDMLKDMDSETVKAAINSQNPTGPLFYWREGLALAALLPAEEDNSGAQFENQKSNMNGFDCRLIKFDDSREACVSDKYGIAVYHKLVAPNPKNPAEKQEVALNLVKIDTTDIPDSTFDLPSGVKKADFDTMMNDMAQKMKSFQ